MWSILKRLGIPVRRNTVMELIRELDPVGVVHRRKRKLRRRTYSVPGPDYLWHIDGHDKLKPYGFSIHGCIDGFSRRIIWLEVGVTNKMPEVVAHYYITALKQLKRLPTRIRSDDGTENSVIEAMKITLRSNDQDQYAGIASYIIGTSPANQKIECFWSQMLKDRPGWWRDFFEDMTNKGLLDAANPIIVECIRFCFMSIIREELQDVAIRWNQHILAPSRASVLPRGRPDVLYFAPELYDCVSCKKEIDEMELAEFDVRAVADNSDEFLEFADIVLRLAGRSFVRPMDICEALQVYFILLEAVDEYL